MNDGQREHAELAKRRVRKQRSVKNGHRSELANRILVALPASAIAVFVVVEGGWIFAVCAILAGIICLREFYRLATPVGPLAIAGGFCVAVLGVAALYGGPHQMVLILMCFILVMFAVVVSSGQRERTTLAMAICVLGVVWIGFAIAHAILLRGLPHGEGVMVDVLVGTFLGDTAAYAGGRLFGRTKMSPRISPNKTVEGLVIGMGASVLAVWFAGLYQDWISATQALLLGAGVALTAPLGDLFESLIKRDLKVKDTGSIFGAHGGALDRLDAVFFSVVAGYYIWNAML